MMTCQHNLIHARLIHLFDADNAQPSTVYAFVNRDAKLRYRQRQGARDGTD